MWSLHLKTCSGQGELYTYRSVRYGLQHNAHLLGTHDSYDDRPHVAVARVSALFSQAEPPADAADTPPPAHPRSSTLVIAFTGAVESEVPHALLTDFIIDHTAVSVEPFAVSLHA